MVPARLGLFIVHNTIYTSSDDPETRYKLVRHRCQCSKAGVINCIACELLTLVTSGQKKLGPCY